MERDLNDNTIDRSENTDQHNNSPVNPDQTSSSQPTSDNSGFSRLVNDAADLQRSYMSTTENLTSQERLDYFHERLGFMRSLNDTLTYEIQKRHETGTLLDPAGQELVNSKIQLDVAVSATLRQLRELEQNTDTNEGDTGTNQGGTDANEGTSGDNTNPLTELDVKELLSFNILDIMEVSFFILSMYLVFIYLTILVSYIFYKKVVNQKRWI